MAKVPDELIPFETVTDEQLGITFEDIDGESGVSSFQTLPYSGVCCTGYAARIFQMFPGRTQIFGFNKDDNPLVECDFFEGHDFAVIDQRYIVDPWFRLVIGDTDNPVVIDTQNPETDRLFIHRYGAETYWKRMNEVEALALKTNKNE